MTGEALDAHVVVDRPGFRLDARVRAAAGEVVALMGPSGAGKSTLLGVLAGLVALDEGRVDVGSRTVDAAPRPRTHVMPARRRVVLLGQDPRLFPHLSARANIAFGPRARGVPAAEAAAAADAWLERVGLTGLGERRPAHLSGGQQQRVALARALATAPAVLLLDEPLTSLDPETAGDIRTVLHDQLQSTRTTAIIATHDVVDAVSLASRLVVLEAGRISQQGIVRDVLAAPESRFVATVAGLNRVPGVVREGIFTAGGLEAAASGIVDGAAAAVFPPSSVRLVAEASASGDREWRARVSRLEQTPGGVRVRVREHDLAVDISTEHAIALGLSPGDHVVLRVEAADVRVLSRAGQ